MVQYRYTDVRLKFADISPNRSRILGGEELGKQLWIPHMVIKNEKETAIMGIGGKDMFISLSPNGEVVFSFRMRVTFYCWMNLKKFPFDSQICRLVWSSCKCNNPDFDQNNNK